MMARSEDPRPYVRVSVDLPQNPKLARLNNPATAWAYVVSMCYSGGSFTDGHFPVDLVLRLAGVPRTAAKALVTQELWHLPGHECPVCPQPKPGDAVVHDYLRHQMSAADAKQLATKRSQAGRAGAAKRWGSTIDDGEPIASAMADAIPGAMANGWQPDGKSIAEEKRREDITNTRAPNGAETEQFDEFWTVYPRKKAKDAARKAYAAALKRGGDHEDILAGVVAYRDECRRERTAEQYIAHASTWLNQGRWKDHLDREQDLFDTPRATFPWEN